MCHESSGTALTESIGIGKGSVSLRDIYDAECIVIAGQNPGTNHPRMLSALEVAKRRGAKIISINPLREAGLVNFRNPQKPRGVVGKGTDIADLHLPIRLNGDLALFQAHRLAAAGVGRASTTSSSSGTPPASRSGPSTYGPSTGTSSSPRPGSAARRSPRPRR